MTDQIPADQARRARQWARDTLDDVENGAHVSAYARDAARTLITMMPRPTLADMTAEERAACRWMQADVANRSVRYVIATPDDGDGESALIAPDGKIEWRFPDTITPRPDLPRMTWPGDKNPDTSDTVPQITLAEGSEWDNADALARACKESGRTQIAVTDKDGDVSVWDASAENWHGPHPIPAYAPFTITHTGRKANQ